MSTLSKRRPQVSVRAALTLDGKISLPQTRTLLSCREGLETAHQSRAEHDAVLVGSSTVRIDNPELSVRYCVGPQPKRVILASSLDISTGARVLAPGPGVMVIGVQGQAPPSRLQALEAAGACVTLVRASDGGLVSLREAFAVLYDWGVRRLLVEGGARILTSLFRERLVDHVSFEIVPILLGSPGVPALANIGVCTLEHAPKLIDLCVKQMGTSILVQGRLEHNGAPEP